MIMKIGIAATASPPNKNIFERGLSVLKNAGFDVYHRANVVRGTNYLAGSDEERLAELIELFERDDVDAIMFARGGYGSQRIIPRIPIELIKKNPKLIIGFSDYTPLVNYLANFGCKCFYGPPVTMLGINNETDESLFSILRDEKVNSVPVHEAKILKEGEARGRIVGGCMILISSSVGTPYEIKPENSILAIEEVNEKVYALDRILTQLVNCGFIKKVRGVLGGRILIPEGQTGLCDMLSERLGCVMGPVIINASFGHSHPFYPIPIGVNCRLIAKNSKVEVAFD